MRWLIAVGLLIVLAACQRGSSPQLEESSRGRAQMWTQNCIRCHNARSPAYYSDREWQVAMHHMRMRCSITRDEYEKILNFLQSAN